MALKGVTINGGAVLEGEKKLRQTFNALPDRVENKVMRQATGNAMKVTMAAARKIVPVVSGLLKKSFGIKRKLYKKSHTAIALMGPRSGDQYSGYAEYPWPAIGRTFSRKSVPWRYGHLVEGGTAPHRQPALARLLHKSNFIHPGAKAQPFEKPALLNNKSAIINRLSVELRKGIEREAAKLAAKGTP